MRCASASTSAVGTCAVAAWRMSALTAASVSCQENPPPLAARTNSAMASRSPGVARPVLRTVDSACPRRSSPMRTRSAAPETSFDLRGRLGRRGEFTITPSFVRRARCAPRLALHAARATLTRRNRRYAKAETVPADSGNCRDSVQRDSRAHSQARPVRRSVHLWRRLGTPPGGAARRASDARSRCGVRKRERS